MALFKLKSKPKKPITRISIAEKGEPKYLFQYKLSLEEFREYNMAVSKDNIEADKKRKRIYGIICLLGAVAFAVMTYLNWADSYARQTYIVATVLLTILGLYTVLFYKLFFEKQLEKGSQKYYDNSVYLQNPITQGFYEDGILEKAAPRDGFFTWDKFNRAWRSENLFYLEFNLANQLMLPIRTINEAGYNVEELLSFCGAKIEEAHNRVENEEEEEALPEDIEADESPLSEDEE